MTSLKHHVMELLYLIRSVVPKPARQVYADQLTILLSADAPLFACEIQSQIPCMQIAVTGITCMSLDAGRLLDTPYNQENLFRTCFPAIKRSWLGFQGSQNF